MIFIRGAWRFILVIKDILVLSFLLLFFAALYAVLSMAPGERPVKAHRGALLLDFDGIIVEQPHQPDPFEELAGGGPAMREYRLRDVVAALESAKDDPEVKAVVLEVDGFMGGGQVALTRVGEALDAVRAAKKPVLTYGTLYQDDGYLLAAHASEIWLNPLGAVGLSGPGGSQLYLKGLIDKLGITAHIYRVGTYKSAVEPLMRSESSDEAKAALQALVDHLWAEWRSDVGKARPQAKIVAYSQQPAAIIEAAKGDMSAAALGAGLVDKLGDSIAFEKRVAEIAGESADGTGPGFATIAFGDYVRAKKSANSGQIGVVTIAGDIVDGEADPGSAGGDSIAMMLEKALDEKDLKALVVRVDSPGGSVLASERIRTAILAAKAKGLPVVTSMGNVAASGGYWVATASDRILAEPSTITGSIGVFGVIPSFEGMLEKIGVTTDGVKTTPLSGEPNVAGGLSPDFNRIMQLGVEDVYRRFLSHVSTARGLTPQQVDPIAQGRVWDGGTARQLKLIDSYGGLEDAIAEAARLAKIDPLHAKPYYIDPEPDPFTAFVTKLIEREDSEARIGAHATDLAGAKAQEQQMVLLRTLADARKLSSGGSIQASCLECRDYLDATAAMSMPKAETNLWTMMLRAIVPGN